MRKCGSVHLFKLKIDEGERKENSRVLFFSCMMMLDDFDVRSIFKVVLFVVIEEKVNETFEPTTLIDSTEEVRERSGISFQRHSLLCVSSPVSLSGLSRQKWKFCHWNLFLFSSGLFPFHHYYSCYEFFYFLILFPSLLTSRLFLFIRPRNISGEDCLRIIHVLAG